MHGPKVVQEPLIDYFQSQILTSQQHIQSMEEIAHKKTIVAHGKEEKEKQSELTKATRATEKASKDATKKIKAVEKEKRELTLKKWKEEDNGGLRKKILQCVSQGGPYSKHIPYGGDPILWQNKVHQKIAKAKLIAKRNRRDNGVPLPNFPPLLQLYWFHRCQAPLLSPSLTHIVPQQVPMNCTYQSTVATQVHGVGI